MRHLLLVFLAGGAMVLSSGAVHGALGDQLAKLTASDGAAGDLFGDSVSLSGDTALVGARSEIVPSVVEG